MAQYGPEQIFTEQRIRKAIARFNRGRENYLRKLRRMYADEVKALAPGEWERQPENLVPGKLSAKAILKEVKDVEDPSQIYSRVRLYEKGFTEYEKTQYLEWRARYHTAAAFKRSAAIGSGSKASVEGFLDWLADIDLIVESITSTQQLRDMLRDTIDPFPTVREVWAASPSDPAYANYSGGLIETFNRAGGSARNENEGK